MIEGEASFWMNKTLVVGNTANQSVGAIGLGSSGVKWITNSTISGNDGPNAFGPSFPEMVEFVIHFTPEDPRPIAPTD